MSKICFQSHSFDSPFKYLYWNTNLLHYCALSWLYQIVLFIPKHFHPPNKSCWADGHVLDQFMEWNWSKIIDWALLRGFLTWASVSIWQERSSVEALFIEESSTYDPEYVKRFGQGIYGCWIYNHMYARDEVGNFNDKSGIVFSHQFLRPAKCWLKSEHNITLFWFFLREFFV